MLDLFWSKYRHLNRSLLFYDHDCQVKQKRCPNNCSFYKVNFLLPCILFVYMSKILSMVMSKYSRLFYEYINLSVLPSFLTIYLLNFKLHSLCSSHHVSQFLFKNIFWEVAKSTIWCQNQTLCWNVTKDWHQTLFDLIHCLHFTVCYGDNSKYDFCLLEFVKKWQIIVSVGIFQRNYKSNTDDEISVLKSTFAITN